MSEPIIHLITTTATQAQMDEMASYYGFRIKVAVDIVQGTLAGGGEWHVPCKEVLMKHGSDPNDIWGAGYQLTNKEIDFLSHINIRPQDENFDRDIFSPDIREAVERIMKERLGV
jgi:hypothetical protein